MRFKDMDEGSILKFEPRPTNDEKYLRAVSNQNGIDFDLARDLAGEHIRSLRALNKKLGANSTLGDTLANLEQEYEALFGKPLIELRHPEDIDVAVDALHQELTKLADHGETTNEDINTALDQVCKTFTCDPNNLRDRFIERHHATPTVWVKRTRKDDRRALSEAYQDRVDAVVKYVLDHHAATPLNKEQLGRTIEAGARYEAPVEFSFKDRPGSKTWPDFIKDVMVGLKGKMRAKPKDSEKRAATAAAKREEKEAMLNKIGFMIQDAVGQAVPDSDPIDMLYPRLQRMGIDQYEIGKWLDAASERVIGMPYQEYLASTWQAYMDNDPVNAIQAGLIVNPWSGQRLDVNGVIMRMIDSGDREVLSLFSAISRLSAGEMRTKLDTKKDNVIRIMLKTIKDNPRSHMVSNAIAAVTKLGIDWPEMDVIKRSMQAEMSEEKMVPGDVLMIEGTSEAVVGTILSVDGGTVIVEGDAYPLDEAERNEIIVESMVQSIITEGRLSEFRPPFSANGLWVSDSRGKSVLEVTSHGPLAKEVADALNRMVSGVSEDSNTLDEVTQGGKVIRTFSGDSYRVPPGQEHEINDYHKAVEVIKRNRRSPVPQDAYDQALKTMEKYETGKTGWKFLDGGLQEADQLDEIWPTSIKRREDIPEPKKWPSRSDNLEDWMRSQIEYFKKKGYDPALLFSPASGDYLPLKIHVGFNFDANAMKAYRNIKAEYPDLVARAKKEISTPLAMQVSKSRVGDPQDYLDEAEYQGREVKLGKPMKGDVKKYRVFVRDPKTGNIKKVNFGDKSMEIKRDDPERRKSFRARHGCGTPRASDRTKAAYWSCRMWSNKPVGDILKGK